MSLPVLHAQDECGCAEVTACPPNSNTSGYGAASVDDCVCNPEYMYLEGACVEVFECPPNSKTEFVLTAGGCMCAGGFVLSGGVCVERFRCPANSQSIAPNSDTSPTSVDDCVCNPGYRLVEGACVKLFECPPNSTMEFVLTAGGCTCADGFVPLASGGGCAELFRCPANSRPVGGLALSLVDCLCDTGFVRSTFGGECVCPLNSVKSPDLNACVCAAGYTRLFSNESCVPESAAPPVALIAGVAVGGSAALAGSVWAVANFMFSAPASTSLMPAAAVGTGSMFSDPAAFQLDFKIRSQFIEYKV